MRRSGLVPAREAAVTPREAEDLRAARQIQSVWPLVVGPVLAEHTRLLHVRRGTLVIGCWHTQHIRELRAAAQNAWPEIQARLQRSLRVRLERLEILPCDAPLPAPAPIPERTTEDPLDTLLHRLRSHQNPDWTKVHG